MQPIPVTTIALQSLVNLIFINVIEATSLFNFLEEVIVYSTFYPGNPSSMRKTMSNSRQHHE